MLRVRDCWVPLDTSVVATRSFNDVQGEIFEFDIRIDLASIPLRIADAVVGRKNPDPRETEQMPQDGETLNFEDASSLGMWTDAVLSGDFSDRCTMYLEVNSTRVGRMGGALFLDGEPEVGEDLDKITYLVTFGRFQKSAIGSLSAIELNETSVTPYVNRRGVLGIRLNGRLADFQSVVVSRLRMMDGVLDLRGELRTRHSRIRQSNLLLTARGLPLKWIVPIRVARDYAWEESHFGHARYNFRARVDFASITSQELPPDLILDAWIESETESFMESRKTTRVGRTPLIQRQLTNTGGVRGGANSTLVIPYYTMKAKRTSFRLERFETPAYDEMRRILKQRTGVFSKGRTGGRPVWIVGEQPSKAQDTGLAFFKYMRREHPEIETYYVIDPSAAEAQNLAGYDHVVDYRSLEHVQLALEAERFIGSHHPSYLYPTRAVEFASCIRARNVFLQHGVIAMKWMAQTYGKTVSSFSTDLFVVSSNREKEFIVNDLGYRPKDVVVTGLSRFDDLFDGKIPIKSQQIFIMPTWRDWLHTGEQFLGSRYFREWHDFLTNPEFVQAVKAHDLDVVFCLHPNMQAYVEHFLDAPVRTVVQGETDVQLLIKESALLITDYSSVAWDFSFLNKPVLFFQFDSRRMFRNAQPHLDVSRELPGPVLSDGLQLVEALVERAQHDMQMRREFRGRADRFIQFRDTNNSQRIFQEVVRLDKPRRSASSGRTKEIRAAAFNYFRKSKYYHPTMRKAYRALSKLPADEGIIFFESGLGRQVNDSPRAIYDELVERGDGRKKVWSVRGRASFEDSRTQVVKRYSPSYFWYLARAKYVVSNQNLPFYIKRGPGRVFMQTWHGTPLKRMAADIDEIHGRDAGYLSRVTTAASQWSILISPSPYATACLRSAYGYSGRAVEFGYPRNDLLASDNIDSESGRIREELGISPTAKTVLYAPTFRDDQPTGNGRFAFDLPFALDAFHERFGNDVVLLIRLHSLVSGRLYVPEGLRDVIIDVSKYPDIQPLYLAADCLVTDYSSVFFDYSLLRRPMVFFAYDLELYRESLRGFYLDYEATVPGPIVTTEGEFLEAISSAINHPESLVDVVDAFRQRFNPAADGHAAERSTDLLLELGMDDS